MVGLQHLGFAISRKPDFPRRLVFNGLSFLKYFLGLMNRVRLVGFYLNNSGLPEWVRQNRNANIQNTDVVIWHNFGITHIPRTEDYPVMPVEYVHI